MSAGAAMEGLFIWRRDEGGAGETEAREDPEGRRCGILHTGLGAVRRIPAPGGKSMPHLVLLGSLSSHQVLAKWLRG